MYDQKTVKKVIKLLEQYNFQITKVARETGIKVRTVTEWKTKYLKGIPINCRVPSIKKRKWTNKEINDVIEYYFEHGCNASMTVRVFGYPACSTLKEWLKKDKRFVRKHNITKKIIKLSSEEQESAVIDLAIRDKSVQKIADQYDITRSTLYGIAKRLTGESSYNLVTLEKHDNNEIKNANEYLIKENKRLLIENKILKKANEILKKEMGDDFSLLSNKEKSQIVIALDNNFKLSDLLNTVGLSKSTFFYQKHALAFDKYKYIKDRITQIFHDNYSCYGYRRIKDSLFSLDGIIISEKVIRRLMKELNLCVYQPKKAKYSSYKGEMGDEIENVIHRDFYSDEPYKKALTDITEFALSDGKVYLSPLIDCYNGLPITWTIGTSPSTELTNLMLDNAFKIIGKSNLLIHSDRGFHYRLDCWTSRMNKYGYQRSMSKKGCSPDNSACEGFFGTIKNEFFYCRNWNYVTCNEFVVELNQYLNWFVTKRIKRRLKYLPNKNNMLMLRK